MDAPCGLGSIVQYAHLVDAGAVEFCRLTESNFHGVKLVD